MWRAVAGNRAAPCPVNSPEFVWRPLRPSATYTASVFCEPVQGPFLLAVHEGVKVYETEEALAASVALHRTVDELVLDRRRRWGTGVLAADRGAD